MKHALRGISLVALTALLSGCSRDPKITTAAVPETVSGIAVVRAELISLPDWVETTGTVHTAQSAQLASQAMGNLTEIRVREGDRVSRGDLLAMVDDAQPKATLEQARAAETAAQKEVSAAETEATLAESTLARYQKLYEKKSVSPQEFDEVRSREQSAAAHSELARAGEAQASAAVALARKLLENTRIVAPFDGVIAEKKLDAGALVMPGTPVFIIEDTAEYRLEANVDESNIHAVRIAQKVPVSIDGLAEQELSGTVAQLVPAADPGSRSFVVKISLPRAAGLRSGLFGRARFPHGMRSAIRAPQTAIVNRGQLRGVYVLDANQVASMRFVTLGRASGNQVEILSGIENGEMLLSLPGQQDYTGKRIAVDP